MLELCKYNFYNDTLHIIEDGKPSKSPYVFYQTDSIPSDYTSIHSIESLNALEIDIPSFDFKRKRDLGKDIIINKAEVAALGVVADPSTIVNPNIGDIYEVGLNAIKDFRHEEGNIAEWDGAKWIFKSKEEVGYDLCTEAEQNILLAWKLGTHSQRLSTAGNIDNLVAKGLFYHTTLAGVSGGVRSIRYAYGLSYVHNHTEHIQIEVDLVPVGNQIALVPNDNSDLDIVNDPPLTPSLGDKVIVGLNGTGVFNGNEKDIAEWDGSAWQFKKRYFKSAPVMVLYFIGKYHPLGLFNYLVNGLIGLVDGDVVPSFCDFFNKTPGSEYHAYNEALEDFSGFTSELPTGLASWKALGDKVRDAIVQGIY